MLAKMPKGQDICLVVPGCGWWVVLYLVAAVMEQPDRLSYFLTFTNIFKYHPRTSDRPTNMKPVRWKISVSINIKLFTYFILHLASLSVPFYSQPTAFHVFSHSPICHNPFLIWSASFVPLTSSFTMSGFCSKLSLFSSFQKYTDFQK